MDPSSLLGRQRCTPLHPLGTPFLVDVLHWLLVNTKGRIVGNTAFSQRPGVRERIVPPLRMSERDPAPPVPAGTLTPDPVPPAVRPQPQPLLRMLMPLVMVSAVVGMVALMVITGRAHTGAGMNPGMIMFPVMMGMGMLAMFLPQSAEDTDEQRRVYMRHLDALRAQANENAHV